MPNSSKLAVAPIPIFSDNYVWRVKAGPAVAVIDPADAGAVIAFLEKEGSPLDLVLLTHHHQDHIAGAEEVARHFGARIVGPARDAARLPPLDIAVNEGDRIGLGDTEAEVIDTDGHTIGHVSYFFPAGPALFCGDTLFSLGCGRLLEGSAGAMFASLQKLKALPPDTSVYCGHEYTQSNARFALSVDPDNAALRRRPEQADRQRAEGRPTLPSLLRDEIAANPFLRAPDTETLARLRREKDGFRG